MSAALSKEKSKTVNSAVAGRFMEMQKKRKKYLQNIKNVQMLTISNIQKESLSNGLQLPVDIHYFKERLV